MFRHSRTLAAPLVLAAIAPAAFAQAATSTPASMTVSATVQSFCSVTATNMAFGTYVSSAAAAQTATLGVTCTNTTPYNVGLSAGSGTISQRTMTSTGGATLNYNLYTSNAYSSVWGNTSATNWQAGTGNGSVQSMTVYGQIPAGQNVTPGSYSDTISVVVNY